MPTRSDKNETAQLITFEEAADYLRFHPSTVYRLARQGAIPAVKVGKQWRIHRKTLDDWVQQQIRTSP